MKTPSAHGTNRARCQRAGTRKLIARLVAEELFVIGVIQVLCLALQHAHPEGMIVVDVDEARRAVAVLLGVVSENGK
ncbi:hypothetical protein EGJ28_22515 [Stutzerimonas xanthomarina]|uniref:Uncharacterized protein n=1 Tax=Stutzerimonas xanthomarina TaxID=271420 RepID=A0A3R8VLX8_9GAMM|nr:hypothetical protein EGJ28_22515 [Stutzerimonas xanthomarina]